MVLGLRQKLGISVFIKTAPTAKLLSWQQHIFMVPSFKNTASIYPGISFIQYFPHFSCKQYDIITDLICIIENRQYNVSLKQKKVFKKEKCHSSAYLKGLSNKQKLFFV